MSLQEGGGEQEGDINRCQKIGYVTAIMYTVNINEGSQHTCFIEKLLVSQKYPQTIHSSRKEGI